MSRKDYEQVAGAIRRELEESAKTRKELDGAVRVALAGVAQRLADIFAFDNPRFDRARFMRACGFDV